MIRPVSIDGTPPRPNPPAPTPTYTAKPHDTVQSVAKSYGVTPEELARTNGMAVTSELSEGQVLQLPANALPAPAPPPLPSNASLQQNTDTALSAYQNAKKQAQTDLQSAPRNMGVRSEISQSDNDQVNKAQQALNTAIQKEIDGEVANRNTGVPPQFRTPTDQLANTFGQAILQRYQGNPQAQSAVSTGVTVYKANAVINVAAASSNSADKLQSLGNGLKGQPQDVVDQALSDPRVQGWINDQASLIDKPYAKVSEENRVGAVNQASDAMGQLQQSTENLPPALASAVVQASMPTIEKVSQLQINQAGGAVPFGSLQSVLAKLGNGDDAKAAIQQVADVYANVGAASSLVRPDSADGELEYSILASPDYGAAGNANFAIALGNALQQRGLNDLAKAAFDSGAKGVQDYLANNGTSVLKQYDAAHSAADEKDQRLTQLIAHAGPMTSAQQQAFIKAYRSDPENAKVYQADADAAKTLATYMQNNKDNLLFAAGRNPDAAKQLYSAMQGLTKSGQGVTALRFAGYVDNDANASKAFDKFSDYHSDFEPEATQAAAGELLYEHNGDQKGMGSELLELADPVFKGHNGWNQVKEGFQSLVDGDEKTFDPKSFAKGFEEMGGKNKVWATLAVTVDSLNGVSAESLNETINAFSMAGGDVSEVGTGVLKVMADAGKFGALNGAADALTKLGSRLVPALGLVASTTAFKSDIESARENTNSVAGAAFALATAGDVISVVGSFMENFPLTSVPGEVVAGIGTIIAAPFELIGHAIVGRKEQQEFQEDQVKYLQAAGFKDEDAEAMAKDGDAINSYAQKVGLSAPQAQQILADHPEAFQGATQSQAMATLTTACGIKPADADGFLSALAKDDPNYITLFNNQVSGPTYNPATPLSNSANMVNLIEQGGYANAKAFVQQNAPQTFSPDGDARRQADRGYETALSMGGTDQAAQIGNLLKSNQSAAYQSEIVDIMKNNGTLANWVRQIKQEDPGVGWSQAGISAIQHAQANHVLNDDQAQQYISQLS